MNDAGTIVQEVKTVFSAEMGGLRREIARLNQATRGANSPLAELHGKLSRLSSVALGASVALGGLAVYGVGSLVKSMISVSAKTETANLGMALMIQSADRLRGRMTPFSAAIGEAAATMDLLRKAARDTPGTLEQVQQAYSAILGAGRRSGMSNASLVNIAAQIATQDALSGTPGLVIRDVSQALRGRNDADSAVLQMSGVVPKAAELARKGRHGQSLQLLSGALQVDPEALKASGASFEGRLATFTDQIDELKRKAGAPLFGALNKELEKASNWLDKNKEQVDRWAQAVGDGLVTALGRVKDVLTWMIEHREEIIRWATILVGASLLVKAVTLAKNVYGVFKDLRGVLELMAGSPFFKAVGVAAALLGGIASILSTGNHYDREGYWVDRNSAGMNLEVPDSVAPGSAAYWKLYFETKAERGIGISDSDVREALKTPGNAEMLSGVPGIGQYAADYVLRKRAGDATQAVGYSGSFGGVEGGEFSAAVFQSAAPKRRPPPGTRNPPFNGGAYIDARNARITLNTRVDTDNPAAFADVSLKTSFLAVAAGPLSATFGLGAPRLATGAP